MKPRKTKDFFALVSKKVLGSLSLWNLLPVFIVVTPASDECLNFGHLPAVIAVPRACVCIFVDLR